MHIHTTAATANHAKSIINEIRKSNQLPFQDILPAESISRRLANLEYRDRTFTPEMTIFAFLAQVMGEDQSCQQAVTQVIAHLARCGRKMPSTNTAAYCKARMRLPEEMLSGLAKETAEEMEKSVEPALLWRNRPIKLPDGTIISMPDTVANQAAYPQSRAQKKGLVFRSLAWLGFFRCRQVVCSIGRWHPTQARALESTRCFASYCTYSVRKTS